MDPIVELTLHEQIIAAAGPILIFIPLFVIALVVIRKITQEDVLKKINL